MGGGLRGGVPFLHVPEKRCPTSWGMHPDVSQVRGGGVTSSGEIQHCPPALHKLELPVLRYHRYRVNNSCPFLGNF